MSNEKYTSKGNPMIFNRNHTKQSMMIDGYGAGKALVTTQLKEDLGGLFMNEHVDAFYYAQQKMSPAAVVLRETFKSIWDETWTEVNWTLPDGFRVQFKPMTTKYIDMNINGFNVNVGITVNMQTSRSTTLGVNVIHSVDAYIARDTIKRCYIDGFSVYTVHDAFFCHPNHATRMKEIYTEVLADIADSTLLEDIIGEITGSKIPKINKGFTGAEIRGRSMYAIS